jgi:Lon protease-like protein
MADKPILSVKAKGNKEAEKTKEQAARLAAISTKAKDKKLTLEDINDKLDIVLSLLTQSKG